MEKICLIYQPCGLGDILFLQKIHNIWRDKGYRIVHPVIHEYAWLSEYLPKSDFPSWKDEKNIIAGPPLPEDCVFPYKEKYDPRSPDFFSDEFVYLNFFKGLQGLVMDYKYRQYGLDYKDWNSYIKLKRNTEKEKYLYYDVLKLKDDEDFVFMNGLFQMRPNIRYINRFPQPSLEGKKVVNMQILSEFTLVDWLMVVEKARTIVMIESALNYLLEIPGISEIISKKELYLYSRVNNFSEVDYLFKLPWKYCSM